MVEKEDVIMINKFPQSLQNSSLLMKSPMALNTPKKQNFNFGDAAFFNQTQTTARASKTRVSLMSAKKLNETPRESTSNTQPVYNPFITDIT